MQSAKKNVVEFMMPTSDAWELWKQTVMQNAASGMTTRDAVYHAYKSLGIKMPKDDAVENIIATLERHRQGQVQALDEGHAVTRSGLIVETLDEDAYAARTRGQS